MELNIVKSTIEVYRIRKDNAWLSDISVDGQGRKVRITVASIHGNWSYYWGACGEDYKTFLVSLDIHYVARKTKNNGFFDVEKAVAELKGNIIECRKEEDITAKEARSYYDAAKHLASYSDINEYEYEHSQSSLINFGSGYPTLSFSIDPRFRQFWQTSWKAFIEKIKEEIEVAKVAKPKKNT